MPIGSLVLLTLSACATRPQVVVPEPVDWQVPALVGSQRACDATALLDVMVSYAGRQPAVDRPGMLGDPLPPPTDARRVQLGQLSLVARCDHASVPDIETSFDVLMLLQEAVWRSTAAALHDGSHGATNDLLDVMAIAQTRRSGALVDIAIGQSLELSALEALEVIAPGLDPLEQTYVAYVLDRLAARRPPMQFTGEAYSASTWSEALPGCLDHLLAHTEALEAAWHSADPLAALEQVPDPEPWERVFEPGALCAVGLGSVSRDLWDADRRLFTQMDDLITTLPASLED